MDELFKPSIFIIGHNEVYSNKSLQLLENFHFKYINILEINLKKSLKDEIVGVLIISSRHCISQDELIMIRSLPRLRAISSIRFVDGVQNFTSKDVIVKCCSGDNADSVADLAITLILNLARNIIKAKQSLNSTSIYYGNPIEYFGMDVKGKILGIVGFGFIGQQIAYKASLAFGMKIVYHQRNKRSDCAFPYYSVLDEMIRISDFIVLSCPLNITTKNLMNMKRIQLMKSTSFIINIAEGGLIETNDLVKSLRYGFIAGAGLDTTDPDPLPNSHPLLHMDNVIVLPRISTFNAETEYSLINNSLINLKSMLGVM